MENTIVWADILVADLDRACAFYSAVLGQEVKPVEGMPGVARITPPADRSLVEALTGMLADKDGPQASSAAVALAKAEGERKCQLRPVAAQSLEPKSSARQPCAHSLQAGRGEIRHLSARAETRSTHQRPQPTDRHRPC